jgi:hypothetical protein
LATFNNCPIAASVVVAAVVVIDDDVVGVAVTKQHC